MRYYSTLRLRLYRKIALIMSMVLLFQVCFPLGAYALTSGPTQPEFSSFEPIGTTQMVDLFSGDFTYNIPLFELPGPDGGYPFNLAYHSGITMDQEASWVGLGWTLNHGAITRGMRGLPDDFDGDQVSRKLDMKPNKTWQLGYNAHAEFTGFNLGAGFALGLKVIHNNYKGWGLGVSYSPSINFLTNNKHGGFGFGYSLSASSFDGAGFQPNFSMGGAQKKLGSLNISTAINSREGIQSLSLGYSNGYTNKRTQERSKKTDRNLRGMFSGTSSYTFGVSAYSPEIAMPYRGKNFTGSIEGGGYTGGFMGIGVETSVAYYHQRLKDRDVEKFNPAMGFFMPNQEARKINLCKI